VIRNDAGALVAFLGTVRDDGIDELQLSAYEEVAGEELESIRKEAMDSFGLCSAAVVHRIGRLKVRDKITLTACAAPHRKEAFDGCRYIIEELKKKGLHLEEGGGPCGEGWIEGGRNPSRIRSREIEAHECGDERH